MGVYHYIIACREVLSWLAFPALSLLLATATGLLNMPKHRETKTWRPARFAIGAEDMEEMDEQFTVLVLNVPVENKALFMLLCERANTIAAADGGANRIKDLNLTKAEENRCFKSPGWFNIICGDLDSIRPEVQDYYANKGFEIIHDPDQYSTDMTKTLEWIRERSVDFSGAFQGKHRTSTPDRRLNIAIFGGLGGRADQAFSQLHHLYKIAIEQPVEYAGDIYLITPESIMFLLQRGMNKIYAPVRPGFFTENVGIIPIGKPATITTRGLQWDVASWHTEFGKDISTSNHIRKDVVEVETTERVLFTMELAAQKGN